MSNHAPHAKVIDPKSGKYAPYIAVPMVLALLIAIPFVRRLRNVNVDPGWLWYQAQVTETKIVIIGNHDPTYHGNGVDYQIRAHVLYQSNGQTHDIWVPVSKPSNDQLFLEFWLSQHSRRSGVIRQNPHNPSDMVFVFQ